MEEIPQLIIKGIVFKEPVTFLTDLAVAVVSVAAAVRLYGMAEASQRHNYRLLFFLMMGISTLAGGISHLLADYISKNVMYASWIVSILGVFMLEVWSLSFLERTNLLSFMAVASSLLLFSGVVAVLIYESFFAVVLRSVVGVFGIVMAARLQIKNTLPPKMFRNFFYGVGFTVLSGIAFIPALKIHDWFNNADFGHVLLAVAVFFYYKGAKAEIEAGY